jgi:NAD(P)-dependent dehydrogenase (short-subunit alcohol dehydrogenase family)
VDAIVAGMAGSGHLAASANLTDLDAHAALIARARSEFGSVYVLAHLAAVLRRQASIDEVTEADWDFQHDINLKAGFFLCRAAASAMREQGQGGRIITFTLQAWWTGGFRGAVVYSATKGGIVSMTRGLARTFGPDGITVNSIAPGVVQTPMAIDGASPERLAATAREIPLGRLAEADEIAGVVVFLASRHASYITGATINVSGGWLMY